jgi:hypothetical protein
MVPFDPRVPYRVDMITEDRPRPPSFAPSVEESGATGRADRWAGRASRWVLPAFLAITCAWLLVTWIPQYLVWPYYCDHDVFATMARAWDHGKLPYRDLVSNNPPGQIYLFWLLGKAFGWGWIAPFYAVDAGFVVILGAAMVAWSRRRLGRYLPGLLGYLVFLWYYLGLDYSLASQRDWEGAFFAVLGLLLAQTWTGRPGRWAMAMAMAVALTFRPQAILLMPAVFLTIDEGVRPRGGSWWTTCRATLEWGVVFAVAVGLVLAPLAGRGLLGDLYRGLSMAAPGSSYNAFGLWAFFTRLLEQAWLPRLWGPFVAVTLLAGRARPEVRRLILVWLVAQSFLFLYGPLSPRVHVSMLHPMMLVASVIVAILASLVLESTRLGETARLATLLILLGMTSARFPVYCRPVESRIVFGLIRRGLLKPSELPVSFQPPGYFRSDPGMIYSAPYPWPMYRDLLYHLRDKTGPETKIANALKGFPALTGPLDRVSAFPAESVAWLILVNRDAEAAFSRSLEQSADSVVVWAPDDPTFDQYESIPKLELLQSTIRRLYEPEAKFGVIEVWRRKATAPPVP